MAKPDPTQTCKTCGRPVQAVLVPGGGNPSYVDMWRFRCECGREWERVIAGQGSGEVKGTSE